MEDMEISRPDQFWASDITYVGTIEGFSHLARDRYVQPARGILS